MAIALDTTSFNSGTTGTSHTLSHTCSGTDRFLVVTLYSSSSTDLVSGVNYNGVAMTRAGRLSNGSSESILVYTLINPDTGANNIVVTTSSSNTIIMQNGSYIGVKQTSQPEQVVTNGYTSSLTTMSTSVTTTSDNAWLAGIFRTGTNQTAIAGTTLRTGVNATLQFGDSNGPKTPTGSYSLGTTFTSGFSAQIVISIAPSGVANSNFFMFF